MQRKWCSQEGAQREVKEEAGLECDITTLLHLDFASSRWMRLSFFGVATGQSSTAQILNLWLCIGKFGFSQLWRKCVWKSLLFSEIIKFWSRFAFFLLNFCVLIQSLPFKGDKKYYDIILTNAYKNNDVIYFLLPLGDFGQSGSHWVKGLTDFIRSKLKIKLLTLFERKVAF